MPINFNPPSVCPVFCARAVFSPVHELYSDIHNNLAVLDSKLTNRGLRSVKEVKLMKKDLAKIAKGLRNQNTFWETQVYRAIDPNTGTWCTKINRIKNETTQLCNNVKTAYQNASKAFRLKKDSTLSSKAREREVH